jgi:hypothetical protein
MGVSGQRHAPAALYPRRKDPQYPTHCSGGWVGPRAGLDAGARRKILCRGSNLDHPARSQTLYCLSYRGSSRFYCSSNTEKAGIQGVKITNYLNNDWHVFFIILKGSDFLAKMYSFTLVTKFRACCGTRESTAVFKRAFHCNLFWAGWDHPTPSHLILRTILIGYQPAVYASVPHKQHICTE